MSTPQSLEPASLPLDLDEPTWGALAHLSTFSGYMVPLGNLLGPLLLYIFLPDRNGFAATHAKEALNFQISMTLYLLIAGIGSLALIGLPVFIALLILDLVCTLVATVRAKDGRAYSYPLTIPFVK